MIGRAVMIAVTLYLLVGRLSHGGAQSSIDSVGPLLVYAVAGIPFCVSFQRWSRDGVGTKAKLGDLSAAEKAAKGGAAAPPSSAGGPPVMDMGMPPMSGPPGSAAGYGYGQQAGYGQQPGYGQQMPPQSGGYGYG